MTEGEKPKSLDREALRERVEAEYDFDRFSPSDMAEMSAEEWEAVFDPDSWVTGEALLRRVEADLSNRVASGELFAAVERRTVDGETCVVAYAERDYAVVHQDGSVEGRGTVLRDVTPAVALCSMPDYEVPDPPAGDALPSPEAIDADPGELGNRMLQVVAAVFAVAGVVLLGAVVLADLGSAFVIAATGGVGFLVFAVFLLVTVANARLSARYRAAEFKDRLAGIQAIKDGEAPFPTEEPVGPGELEGGERSDDPVDDDEPVNERIPETDGTSDSETGGVEGVPSDDERRTE